MRGAHAIHHHRSLMAGDNQANSCGFLWVRMASGPAAAPRPNTCGFWARRGETTEDTEGPQKTQKAAGGRGARLRALTKPSRFLGVARGNHGRHRKATENREGRSVGAALKAAPTSPPLVRGNTLP